MWSRHRSLRFGELIAEIAIWRRGRIGVFGLEEDDFDQMVHEWEQANPPSANVGGAARDTLAIAEFLGRVGESWRREPDQRFGQFVSNVVRFVLPLDTMRMMGDEDFLALLDEWDASHTGSS